MNEYEQFHTARIINTLLNQQTPRNDHGINGITEGGNWKDITTEQKARTIISSLFELGIIIFEEKVAIDEMLDSREKIWTTQD